MDELTADTDPETWLLVSQTPGIGSRYFQRLIDHFGNPGKILQAPRQTLADLGIPQQLELVDRCEIVVDAADFLGDPPAYQREICRRLSIDFDEAMLAWPAGARPTDGVWARYWYDSVQSSTGFGPPVTTDVPGVPAHLVDIANDAMDAYAVLRRHRLVL